MLKQTRDKIQKSWSISHSTLSKDISLGSMMVYASLLLVPVLLHHRHRHRHRL